ncbi:MAG: HEAT repeat domain-containing protein [Ilumatobacteraceae bacterium]
MHASPVTLVAVTLAAHACDLPTLEAAFEGDDAHVRAIALGALHGCDALTPRHIALALTDPERLVRHRLAQVAAHDTRVDLLRMLADDDFAVAETAAWALGERGNVSDGEMQALVMSATTHTHPLVRESCVAALGSIGDERGLPAILHAYNDKPAVRRRAVISLAPFDSPEVTAALRAALSDRDWQVRQAAEDLLAAAELSDSETGPDAS